MRVPGQILERSKMQYKYHNSTILKRKNISDEIIERIINNSLSIDIAMAINFTDFHPGEEFCDDCDACFDALHNTQLIVNFITGKIDRQMVAIQKQQWNYSFLTDKAVHGLGDMSQLSINREAIVLTGTTCYIDQNILTQAVNKLEFFELLTKARIKHDLIIIGSFSHFEEIFKITNVERRDKFVEVLMSLSDGVNLQPCNIDDRIKPFFESAPLILSRIEMTAASSEAVEMLKNLKDEDRRLYFEKYNDLEYRKRIGSSADIFNELTESEFSELVCMSSPPGHLKSDFKNLVHHEEIRDAIYSLHNTMDLMSYKQDKSSRTQRSSAHDIEHLIYGSQCDYFVTNDSNLRQRATEIYRFLEFPVRVLSLSEISSLLDSEWA